jgi:FtsP/CotA-like multicopper oxidase with cupredoxin domain
VGIAGRTARLYGFNGRVPGPTLEARPGDTVRLSFTNRLPEPTNLHYHGLHVPPVGRADNIFLEIPPGESLQYEFTLPGDHPAGLFWYHPHLHGLVARQVGRGLAAPLIVRGDLDAVPEVAAATEHVLVLQDFALDRDGGVQEPGMMERMQGREGEIVAVGGEQGVILPISQGGLLRLRLLNASPSRFYLLSVEQHPMHLIATDGGGLPQPAAIDELLLAPGERSDVLVSGERADGDFRLLARPYARGSMDMGGMGGMMGPMGGMGTPRENAPLVLAAIRYQGRAARRLTVPARVVDVPPLAAPVRVRRFVLGMGMRMGQGMSFSIDGREFDHQRIDTRVRLGEIEEWEYVNTTPMDHPMHLHTNPFQVIGFGGRPEPHWKDVVLVKANGWARVRVAFRDFAGRTVHHCHILDHEDLGMMATVEMSA